MSIISNKEVKEYSFNIHAEGKYAPRIEVVKEKDLEDRHIKLLFGTLVKNFDDMPDKVKELFLSKVVKERIENVVTDTLKDYIDPTKDMNEEQAKAFDKAMREVYINRRGL